MSLFLRPFGLSRLSSLGQSPPPLLSVGFTRGRSPLVGGAGSIADCHRFLLAVSVLSVGLVRGVCQETNPSRLFAGCSPETRLASHILPTLSLPTGSDECDDRKQFSAKYSEFESISGSPETLRNLERVICKTALLGSQSFCSQLC